MSIMIRERQPGTSGKLGSPKTKNRDSRISLKQQNKPTPAMRENAKSRETLLKHVSVLPAWADLIDSLRVKRGLVVSNERQIMSHAFQGL